MEIKKGDWVYGVVNLDDKKIPAFVFNITKDNEVWVYSFERGIIIDTDEQETKLIKIPEKLAFILLGKENFELLKNKNE